MSTGLLHNAIKCAICNHPFFSVMLDEKDFVQDLVQKLSLHYSNKHKEEITKNAESSKVLIQTLLSYVFLSNMAVIPEANVRLTHYGNELTEDLIRQLGFKENELDDDDEEDSEFEEMLIKLASITNSTTDPNTKQELTELLNEISEETDMEEEIEEDNQMELPIAEIEEKGS